MRISKDFRTSIAAIAGSLPGFTLPFALSYVLTTTQSDLVLLTMSGAIASATIVSAAIEVNTIAECGRQIAVMGGVSSRSLQAYRKRALTFGVVAGITIDALMTTSYSLTQMSSSEYWTLSSVTALTPIIASFSSLYSGELIARGGSVLAVAVQALRSCVPVLVVVLVPLGSLVPIVLSLVSGEGLRALILRRACAKRAAHQPPLGTASSASDQQLHSNGLLWQATSSGVTQTGPAVDRLFLANTGAGLVSSYEVGDRLLNAVAQFLNMGLLYRRVARWATLPTLLPSQGRKLLLRDLRVLGIAALVFSVLGVAALFVVSRQQVFGLPPSWRQGALWGALLFLCIPAYEFSFVGTRLLVICRKQRYLLVLSGVTTVLNGLLDAILLLLIGPLGIIVATVIVRWVMAIVYAAVLIRALRDMLGVEGKMTDKNTQLMELSSELGVD